MTRQAIYDRLRAIGVSVESADAVSEALEPLPDKKVEAFLLWLGGYTHKEIGHKFKMDRSSITKIINNIFTHCIQKPTI
jgi:DNA-directed RNA polymerase specialized sigma24 family protein